MTYRITKNDQVLLSFIGNFTLLTVEQLAALSQRSRQVVRRRLRVMTKEGLVHSKVWGYGQGRGRPKEIFFLAEKGTEAFRNDKASQRQTVISSEKKINFVSVDHEILLNWFIIHLLHTEKVLPQLSVTYISPSYSSSFQDHKGFLNIREKVSQRDNEDVSVEFIPDGVFSITIGETEKKTVLFFLEVDMGTEPVASPDGSSKDVRQKIINYQTLFQQGLYKRYERVFNSRLNGFRLLILTSTAARSVALCRLARELPPSDFVWVTDQNRMFSKGLSAEIWSRGGKQDVSPQSIIGPRLACPAPVLSDIK
jgi:hypothetical protein